MLALIDGDIIVYSCGFSAQKTRHIVTFGDDGFGLVGFDYKKDCSKFTATLDKEGVSYEVNEETEAEPVENALHNAKVLIERILETTRAAACYVYLTGDDNFRDKIYTEYKANRPDRKPVHYAALKKYLVSTYGAVVTYGCEADDALSIVQNQSYIDTIICTIDKDLDMVPGNHYNWKHDRLYEVDEITGTRTFYKQVLTGDMSVDNIPGLYKTTGVKASKKYKDYIDGLDNEWDMWDFVLGLYGEENLERLILIARLLWMQTYEGEEWQPPQEPGEEVHGEVQPTGEDGEQKEVQEEG